MKRQGTVLNAREVRAGRKLLRAAKKASYLTKQAGALLSRGPAFAVQFYRAANMAAYEGTITGLITALLIKAAYDPAEADKLAAEYTEASWHQLVSAIRYIRSA